MGIEKWGIEEGGNRKMGNQVKVNRERDKKGAYQDCDKHLEEYHNFCPEDIFSRDQCCLQRRAIFSSTWLVAVP